jgi:hypothetical protein
MILFKIKILGSIWVYSVHISIDPKNQNYCDNICFSFVYWIIIIIWILIGLLILCFPCVILCFIYICEQIEKIYNKFKSK